MPEKASTNIESHFSRVLVVDDDASIRELLRVQLTKAGYDVVLATNGEEALAKAAEFPPDIVLIDVLMPHLDGYETSAKLKADDSTSSVPILMVSAMGGPTDRVRALDIGIDDFINKPFDRIEMLARVRSLLRVKRLHQSLADSNEELQKAYESARNAQARYRSLVEDALDAIFVVDIGTGKIIECNAAASTLTGLDEPTLSQYAIADLVSLDVKAEASRQLADPNCREFESQLSGSGGGSVPIYVRCSRVRSINGELDQYTVRDLTLEREVQSERLKTERLDGVIQTAVTVNDEVNNPLTVILGNTEFIRKELAKVNVTATGHLDNIVGSVQRIQTVMERLTRITHPETKEFIPGTDMLDLERSVVHDEVGE